MSPRHQNTKLGLGGKKKLSKTHKHYDKRSNKNDDHCVSVSWFLQSWFSGKNDYLRIESKQKQKVGFKVSWTQQSQAGLLVVKL